MAAENISDCNLTLFAEILGCGGGGDAGVSRILEDNTTRILEDGTTRILE